MEETPAASEASETPPTFRRLRLRVAYDGGPHNGWQSQAGGNTVQDKLEAAFAELCGGGRRIVVHGSGRTDAGVHSRGQVAHADVPAENRIPAIKWPGALNACLPPSIRVEGARFVSTDFHARFSAKGKIYRYRIWNAPALNPFETGRAWHLPGGVDMETLRAGAAKLTGQHDFGAFAANRGRPSETTVRTIHRIDIRRGGRLLTLEFEGDGFLYKMVRLLTGTIVRCAQGRIPLARIDALLADAGKTMKTNLCAPAQGLYLMRVLY